MSKLLVIGSLMLTAIVASSVARAQSEIDSEKSVTNSRRATVQGAVVLRVDTRDNSLSVLSADKLPKNETEAQALAKNTDQFKALSRENVRSELDRDGGTSSWYFYCGNWSYPYYSYQYYGYSYYYPTYYYYGYAYQPYYSYNYSYYNYYYYGYSRPWSGWGYSGHHGRRW